MRYFVGLGGLVIAFLIGLSPALTEPSYHRDTVQAAQEALARLGYDVGAADGAWGRKSRTAMNALRAEHGLPAAENLSGSSLALVHRLSPGETTLARPGFFFVDVHARREWLRAEDDVARDHCSYRGPGSPLASFQPRMDSLVDAANQPGDADWFTEIGEVMTATLSRCIKGDQQCQMFVDTVGRWAEANALQTTLTPADPRYENTKSAANYTLRGMMIGYGIARQFTPVPPEREAVILDWFKDRADTFHHIYPDSTPVGSVDSARANNHGIANYLPALIFGILVGDRSMMQPAIDNWHEAMLFIREDGSFPTEASRGGAWLHYSTLQLSRFLSTSELVLPQGIDLAAGFDDPRYSIPQAVRFVLDALENFDIAEQYSRLNKLPFEEFSPRTPLIRGHMFAFLPTYAERYGEDENMRRIATATVDEEICDDHVLQEGKFTNTYLCKTHENGPLPLNSVAEFVMPEPNWHMGYPAGCLQGTKTWNELLGLP